jgi:hypothetical protein
MVMLHRPLLNSAPHPWQFVAQQHDVIALFPDLVLPIGQMVFVGILVSTGGLGLA